MNFDSDTLVKEIENYISDRTYNYAIMINGPWGCGKSFFIQEKAKDYLKSYESYIYISLNGLRDLEELTKQIYVQNYLGNENGSRIASITRTVGTLAFNYLEKKGIDTETIGTVSQFVKEQISIKENTVLVFDDLERARIPINEILGYINSFVEQQHLKVIVVANENEINRNLENIELKYLVALNKEIDFNLKDRHGNDKLTVEELKNKTLKVFDEISEYEKIKEKLFGETFNYTPNLEKSCEEILNNLKRVYTNSYGIELILERIPEICKIMRNCNHTNLRTFQFYLSKMMTLGKKLQIDIRDENKELFEKYLIFSFKECVCYKLGEEQDRIDFVETLLAQYIRGDLFLDDELINEIKINYNYMKVDAELNKKVSDFLSWVTKNAKITQDNFEYISKNAYLIDINILGKILISCAKLQRMGVLSEDKIRDFLNNIKMNSGLNSEENIRKIEIHKKFLDNEDEKEIFMKYIPFLKGTEDLVFYNPLSDWIDDKIEKYINFDAFSVVDRAYLSEEIIEEISKSIKNESSAETIWYLRDLLSKVFSEYNIGNIFHSTLEHNLCELKNLSENIDKMLKDSDFTDPIIKNAVYRLNCELIKIYSSCQGE